MKIPLNEISTPGLLRLMRDVAAELEARHNAPAVQHVQATRQSRSLGYAHWPELGRCAH